MKKFLSLVLALVMTMSLVTVSAGAKDFGDSADLSGEAYEEAVNVMSEMGIIDGYSDGDFRPQGTLTRQAAAKIIAGMMLGKTTAESLGTQAAPFKDVPAGSSFAGYIAFCVERGLISGYADGTFRPTGTLTGFAFLKMLLGALGYDQSIEGYTGTNWTVNVAGRAYEIGLTDGNDEFVGSQACTREEAALYAVNTLKATLVEYENKGSSITINGIEVVQGASEPTYVTTSVYNAASSISADRDNSGDYTVEFAERYQPDLKMTADTDDFMRPAHTWSWKNREIGTYMNYDELIAEYTTGVTGRELYDVLTATTIREYSLDAYLDGGVNDGGDADTRIVKTNLVRSNDEDLNGTGNGVLTQVFVDNEDEEIVIASINTYLAKATADYSERQERLTLTVYTGARANGNDIETVEETKTVDLEDVPSIEGVTEDQFVLVNMSEKDRNDLEVVDLFDVETLSDVDVTRFSQSGNNVDHGIFSKVTADGTAYDSAEKAVYSDEVLNLYDDGLLTDMSYNVFIDQYGYAIGVELYEGTLNYVFITGYDRGRSNISVKTADAAAIFTDGTMTEITVDVEDTNDYIQDAIDDNAGNETVLRYLNGTKFDGSGTSIQNRWYTYTVDSNGVYTLKPVTRMFATAYSEDDHQTTINCSNVRLNDTFAANHRAYGNDNSVYITVELGTVDATQGNPTNVITDVTGVYTGVQDVDIDIDPNVGDIVNQVYTVYDRDQYIIASIVLGEAQGSVANYAYILSDENSEERIDGEYYWEFDAIVDGEIVTLTARGDYNDTVGKLNVGKVMELRYDGEYVVGVKEVADTVDENKVYDKTQDYGDPIDEQEVYDVELRSNDVTDYELWLEGRTLYSSEDDYGLTFTSDAKAVVIQDENRKEVKTEYDSVSQAIGSLADPSNKIGLQFQGRLVAILNSQGVAEWIIFISDTDVRTGTVNDDVDNNGEVRYISADAVQLTITLDEDDKPEDGRAWTEDEKDAVDAAAKAALASIGYRAVGDATFGAGAGDTIVAVNMDSANPAQFTFRIIWG